MTIFNRNNVMNLFLTTILVAAGLATFTRPREESVRIQDVHLMPLIIEPINPRQMPGPIIPPTERLPGVERLPPIENAPYVEPLPDTSGQPPYNHVLPGEQYPIAGQNKENKENPRKHDIYSRLRDLVEEPAKLGDLNLPECFPPSQQLRSPNARFPPMGIHDNFTGWTNAPYNTMDIHIRLAREHGESSMRIEVIDEDGNSKQVPLVPNYRSARITRAKPMYPPKKLPEGHDFNAKPIPLPSTQFRMQFPSYTG